MNKETQNDDELQNVNNQYFQLAAKLGDIEFKILQYHKEIQNLQDAKDVTIESIEALNHLAAKLKSISAQKANVNLKTNQAEKAKKD